MHIKYRAIHENVPWKRVGNHKSLDGAIDGEKGAKRVLLGIGEYVRNLWSERGRPSCIFVWEVGSQLGYIFRINPESMREVQMARVPVDLLEQYDKVQGCSESEIERHFQNPAPSLGSPVGEPEVDKTPDETQTPVDERILTAIQTRRGQTEFRAKLLLAYGSKCAISDCDTIESLEAAHIIPFSEENNYSMNNGILMRADIHTLFDLFLLSIHPSTGALHIAPSLVSAYGELEGKQVSLPYDHGARPDPERLARHFNAWNMRWSHID